MLGTLSPSEIIVGFIFAILLGLIPANIAKKKGYSFGLWWVFGFLFFIIALIVALLAKDKTAKDQLQLKEEIIPGMEKCPYCKENIKQEAAVCNYCGESVK